jgi:cell division protein FtsW
MLRTGHIVILCALALLTLGVVMVNSAEMAVNPISSSATLDDATANTSPGIAKNGVTFRSIATSTASKHLLLALAALTIAAFAPIGLLRSTITRLGRRFNPLILLGILAVGTVAILSTVYWPGISRPVNGSHRWVTLGPLHSLQPSELAKWLLIWIIAAYAVWKGRDGLAKFWTGFFPAVVAIGLVCSFVVLEDLGTGVLMAAAASLVLLAAGGRILHFALPVPIALVGIAIAIIQNPYRIQRVTSFLDPYADPQNSGFHMIQSMATVAGGGITGRGLGNGLQKFGYLPEDQTDFLFAIICEELGLAGALLTLTLYAVLAFAILSVVQRTRSTLLRLGALGILATITIQASINLLVVTGLGPTKGIALPLLSAGGTGWILTAACLGLIVAIDRHTPRDEPAFEPDLDPVPA